MEQRKEGMPGRLTALCRQLENAIDDMQSEKEMEDRNALLRSVKAKADAEIMKACRSVALAYDRFEKAGHYSADERLTRVKLEKEAAKLKNIMVKYGRMGPCD